MESNFNVPKSMTRIVLGALLCSVGFDSGHGGVRASVIQNNIRELSQDSVAATLSD